MAGEQKKGLTDLEKRIVKALFAKGRRNQDIHAWINSGRQTAVNFGRVSNVKSDANQKPATDDEVAYFMLHRQAYDSQTGLNRYDDERLIRAREAMILAVQVFNSAGLKFKTEVFTMLANVAWTYLMHEYYMRKTTVQIVNEQGQSMALSEMIARQDCPLKDGVKKNLNALKILRDRVEHHLLGKADLKWLGMFQACCLNFDRTICEIFGDRLTLANDLSFALQFARMNLDQVTQINKYELPEHIAAVDALITEGMTSEQINDTDFQFQVVYTLTAAPKSKAHIQFVNPDSAEGKEIHNVLSKKVAADELYPYKPSKVVKLVAAKTKKGFTSHNHLQAIRKYKIRPKNGSAQPENTDKAYCIYHAAHKDYTYSDAWMEKLVEAVKDAQEFAAIRAVKVK
ncbi:hypothetical protein QFZ27_007227 [Inquilinus ginsengisoli]|uniref:DUF3644 domain-containing protein n=1 Tax=Inquilinus ginsengisoli TaxID=363840 RepID=UPI003D1F9B19